jgi:hypothetical protein
MNPKSGGPSQGVRNSIPEMGKSGVENNFGINNVMKLDVKQLKGISKQ